MKECPKDWTDERKQIFNELAENVVDLIPVDWELLTLTAISIDKLRYMNDKLDKMNSLLGDKIFMSTREKFVKEVTNYLKMLDITPQARNKAKGEPPKVITDPLEKLLADID